MDLGNLRRDVRVGRGPAGEPVTSERRAEQAYGFIAVASCANWVSASYERGEQVFDVDAPFGGGGFVWHTIVAILKLWLILMAPLGWWSTGQGTIDTVSRVVCAHGYAVPGCSGPLLPFNAPNP